MLYIKVIDWYQVKTVHSKIFLYWNGCCDWLEQNSFHSINKSLTRGEAYQEIHSIVHESLPVGILFEVKSVGFTANGKRYVHVYRCNNFRVQLCVADDSLEEDDLYMRDR